MLAAQGKWVVFLDADLSTPPEEIDNALRYLNDGYEMVIGSRALPDSQIEKEAASVSATGNGDLRSGEAFDGRAVAVFGYSMWVQSL